MRFPRIVRLGIVSAAVAVLILAYPVAAGTGHVVKCSDCGLGARLFYHSGKASTTVAVGYCCQCEEFVHISESRGAGVAEEEQQKSTEPIGTVFCHESGQRHAVYACPECGKPFIAIEPDAFGTPSEPKKLHCPKCGKQTLETAGTILWD